MKFSCGFTRKSLLYKEGQEVSAEAERLRKWHKKFLWWPTTTSEKDGKRICQWLTFVERRYPYVEAVLEEFILYDTSWIICGKYVVEYRDIKKED